LLVGVHSKFGISSFCRFGDLRDIETVITDDGLSPTQARRYAELGPQVLRV
jgi:DeoR/GlpR family transcriptional regulator of sugar metabolism